MSVGANVEHEAAGASWPQQPDLSATGERIESLLAGFAASGRPMVERAEDLLRLVAELYGAGLERLLEIGYDAGALTPEVLERLADDELVSSLLVVHGLHPYDMPTRVGRALDGLRVDLAAQGAAVELADLDETGTVHLRLSGASGCGATAMIDSVTTAVEAAVPDATGVVCEQVTAPSAPTLIPLSSLTVRTRGEVVGS